MRDGGVFVHGDAGTEIVPELQPAAGEALIQKHTLSPFAGTGLGELLTREKVGTVVLAGFVTHYVIQATGFAAYDAGYNVIVLKDCCASGSAERHNHALAVLDPLAECLDSGTFLSRLDS